MKLEIYLYKDFNETEFKEIKNRPESCLNKPFGGLWTSPVGSDLSWKSWCTQEEFRTDPEYDKHHYVITLKSDAKLYRVDSLYQALRAPLIKRDLRPSFLDEELIDFEELQKQGYSGFWLTSRGAIDLHLPPFGPHEKNICFNSWDVETVLLFNLNCISEIKKVH